MSAGADVPRFADQLAVAQQRVLRNRLQQRRRGIEAVLAAAKSRREIETKPIDAGHLNVITKNIHGQTQHGRAIKRERVAAAGVVDIARGIAR